MIARLAEVLLVACKLGLTSFGGPVAHLGYFRDEYVTRRKWLDEAAYADLVALCQFLPGPASSQVGMAVGMTRAGIGGGVAAWLGFTLPSALLLILFGYGMTALDHLATAGWLSGLKVVAVAVVAFAVYGMARTLAPDPPCLGGGGHRHRHAVLAHAADPGAGDRRGGCRRRAPVEG